MKKSRLLIAVFVLLATTSCVDKKNSSYDSEVSFISTSFKMGPINDHKALKIFDYFSSSKDPNYLKGTTFNLEEFPNYTFKTGNKGKLFENENRKCEASTQSLYVCDVNNDGYRDFCYTTEQIKDIGGYYIGIDIYDFKHDQIVYSLRETKHNYYLDILDENLVVKQIAEALDYGDECLIGSFEDKTPLNIRIDWENKYEILNSSLKIKYFDGSLKELKPKISNGKEYLINDFYCYFFEYNFVTKKELTLIDALYFMAFNNLNLYKDPNLEFYTFNRNNDEYSIVYKMYPENFNYIDYEVFCSNFSETFKFEVEKYIGEKKSIADVCGLDSNVSKIEIDILYSNNTSSVPDETIFIESKALINAQIKDFENTFLVKGDEPYVRNNNASTLIYKLNFFDNSEISFTNKQSTINIDGTNYYLREKLNPYAFSN